MRVKPSRPSLSGESRIKSEAGSLYPGGSHPKNECSWRIPNKLRWYNWVTTGSFAQVSKAQGPEVRQEICFHGTFCHGVHVMEAGVAYDGVCEEDSKPRLSWWRFPLEIGDCWKVSLQF